MEADAAKHTAKINGLGSSPKFIEETIAIGVTIIAAAAFDDVSVSIMVKR